jgi:hypothetical protein
LVTVTSTVPEPGGLVAVTWVALTGVKEAAGVLPKLTPLAPLNPLPVMVTLVPPEPGPLVGLSLDTTGAARLAAVAGPATSAGPALAPMRASPTADMTLRNVVLGTMPPTLQRAHTCSNTVRKREGRG